MMTLNFAVPYSEPTGDFGFVLTADRNTELIVSPEKNPEQATRSRVDACKVYATAKRAATVVGKIDLLVRGEPVLNGIETALAMCLDDVDYPDIRMLEGTEAAIFAAEVVGDAVELYMKLILGDFCDTIHLCSLPRQMPSSRVLYLNSFYYGVYADTGGSCPDLQSAAEFSRKFYNQADKAVPDAFKGRDMYSVSLQGVSLIESIAGSAE